MPSATPCYKNKFVIRSKILWELMNDNSFLFGSQTTWWSSDFYLKHMCEIKRKNIRFKYFISTNSCFFLFYFCFYIKDCCRLRFIFPSNNSLFRCFHFWIFSPNISIALFVFKILILNCITWSCIYIKNVLYLCTDFNNQLKIWEFFLMGGGCYNHDSDTG
jgi:hypothetical protein